MPKHREMRRRAAMPGVLRRHLRVLDVDAGMVCTVVSARFGCRDGRIAVRAHLGCRDGPHYRKRSMQMSRTRIAANARCKCCAPALPLALDADARCLRIRSARHGCRSGPRCHRRSMRMRGTCAAASARCGCRSGPRCRERTAAVSAPPGGGARRPELTVSPGGPRPSIIVPIIEGSKPGGRFGKGLLWNAEPRRSKGAY